MDVDRDNAGRDEPGLCGPDCDRAALLIERELAGRLTPEESLELSTHVAECRACREYMADASVLAGTFAMIRAEWDKAPAPPVARSMFARVAPYAVGLAAGLLIAFCVSVFVRGRPAADRHVTATVAGGVGSVAEETLGIVAESEEAGGPLAPSVTVGGLGSGARPARHIGGLLVVGVKAGSWAENAGIRPGDRLLEASDTVIDAEAGRQALDYILRNAKPGNRMDLLFWREGAGVVRACYLVPDTL
ncbi:MAG: hypothetical protein JW909_11350 [Planctomycetes bacterium]|nr:hypothetical protein [Planctomycetota bacterium]